MSCTGGPLKACHQPLPYARAPIPKGNEVQAAVKKRWIKSEGGNENIYMMRVTEWGRKRKYIHDEGD